MRNFEFGFTIIELLIVISLISVLSIVSIASFSSFNNTQQLTSTALDLKNILQQAKAQVFSQVDTCPSGQSFKGYEVLVCCSSSASCKTCNSLSNPSSDGYELDLVCSSSVSPLKGKAAPKGISIDTSAGKTTTYTVLFNSLTDS